MQGNRSFPRSGALATPRHCFRRPEGRSQSARGETSGDLQTLRECLERHLKQEAGEVEGGSSAPRPGSRLRDVRALRWEDGAGWSGMERHGAAGRALLRLSAGASPPVAPHHPPRLCGEGSLPLWPGCACSPGRPQGTAGEVS